MNAIVPVDGCSPVAFEDVFEPGDRWEKIRGCDDCPMQRRLECCGTCAMLLHDTGECRLHNRRQEKPLRCVVKESPDMCKRECSLEFLSVRGSRSGQIRKLRDRGSVFHG